MKAVSTRRLMMACAAMAVLLAPAWALAQDAPSHAGDDPVLQSLINEALARNPDLMAADASIRSSRERANQLSARPDPMLSTTYTNDGWAPSLGSMPMTTLGVMVSQELPYKGKRQARVDVATSAARQAEPPLVRARLGIEAAVKRAYYGLLLARELLKLTGEQRDLWRDIEVVARGRYAVGQGAQQDVLRVQVEVTRIEQRAIEQAAEAELRLAEINRLLARSINTRVETSARLALSPLSVTLESAIDGARSVSPELASARLAISTEKSVQAAAQLDFKPDFAIQGGYMNRGGLDPMWLAGFSMTLPINKQKRTSAIAESQIRAEGEQRVIESLDLLLRLRTQERVTRARTAEKIVDLYDQGIVPQDRMTVESSLANYQSGRVPFVSVLEAMTSLYADRWTRENLVADHARLLASLQEASLEASPEMTTVGTMTAAGSGIVPAAMGSGMGGRQE